MRTLQKPQWLRQVSYAYPRLGAHLKQAVFLPSFPKNDSGDTLKTKVPSKRGDCTFIIISEISLRSLQKFLRQRRYNFANAIVARGLVRKIYGQGHCRGGELSSGSKVYACEQRREGGLHLLSSPCGGSEQTIAKMVTEIWTDEKSWESKG